MQTCAHVCVSHATSTVAQTENNVSSNRGGIIVSHFVSINSDASNAKLLANTRMTN